MDLRGSAGSGSSSLGGVGETNEGEEEVEGELPVSLGGGEA